MKLSVPLPLRRHAAQRFPAWCGATRRCTTNSKSGSGTSSGRKAAEEGAAAPRAATANTVTSVRVATPGTVRVRRGTDPRAQEMEMDTTITRMMGSDWGDRSKQPVSYAMKLYWGIFILVLANGAYTYFTGKDEAYLVETVQKKVDEKLGRVETNEFVIMADQQKAKAAAAAEATKAFEAATETAARGPEVAKEHAPKPAEKEFDFENDAPATSMFASKPPPTPLPLFAGPIAQRPLSKADYAQQLQQLRERQARAKEERKDPSGFRSIDEIDLEIKRIDQQKAQVKQILKKL